MPFPYGARAPDPAAARPGSGRDLHAEITRPRREAIDEAARRFRGVLDRLSEFDSRELDIARQKLDEAEMWALKSLGY